MCVRLTAEVDFEDMLAGADDVDAEGGRTLHGAILAAERGDGFAVCRIWRYARRKVLI